MRLSIWNQFSSNHSTLFTVVGQFEMNEAAQTAYEVWLRLIKGVIEWRKEHPNPNFEVLTPIELEYNQRYNIQLDDVTALDWFGDDPERVLDQYDNILMVGTIKETHHGPVGSEALMKALGGKAVTDSYEACEVILTTTCVAPDDTTAQRIYDEILAGMRETPGENYDYENNGYVEAVHILLDAPEAIKGEYQLFEMKRSGRNFTFISTLADPDYVTYLRSQGFTNLHHQVKQIPDWGISEP